MIRAVLSIGSNMEDRHALLQTVADEFRDEIVAASQVYSTPPWGVTDQPEFLNAVLIVEVAQSPLELLHRGQELEQAAQRKRIQHWGPRTLDVDIVVAYDEHGAEIHSATAELMLPHPHAHERDFVLVPWLDADPAAQLGGKSARELLSDDADVVQSVGRLRL